MPSPVEALPCGSRSMMSTRSPMAASAVPRLMAVVVLPTPPFWLAIARTRAGAAASGFVSPRNGTTSPEFTSAAFSSSDMVCRPFRPNPPAPHPSASHRTALESAHDHDAAGRIGLAWCEFRLDVPIFSGFGQLNLNILTFEEQGLCTCFQKRRHVVEQCGKRCERACRDDVGLRVERQRLDAGVMHGRRQCELAANLAQERGFLTGAFDQVNRRPGSIRQRAGDRHAGKAAARSEIEPDPRLWREPEELQRIRDMAGPQLRHAARSDQIGAALGGEQQRYEAIKPNQCFT